MKQPLSLAPLALLSAPRALVFLLPVLLLASGCQTLSPRRSEEALRQSLLAEMPLGTPMETVEAWVGARRWQHVRVDREHGFFKNAPQTKDWATIGRKSITARLGDYVSFPVGLVTAVQVSWGFDEQGRMIAVHIVKSADGP